MNDQFTVGVQVAYVPTEAEGDVWHETCQYGFVTSQSEADPEDPSVFCRFFRERGKPELRTKGNSERTYVRDLIQVNTIDQQVVMELLVELNYLPSVVLLQFQ